MPFRQGLLFSHRQVFECKQRNLVLGFPQRSVLGWELYSAPAAV